MDRLLTRAQDLDAVLAQGGDLHADAGQDLLGRPAGLLLDHGRLVLVGEQERSPVDELADQVATAEGQLLAGVGDEGVAALAALLGVAQHPVRVVGGDQHELGAADLRDDRRELDQAGLAHRTGVERRDLGAGRVGGAHEAGRVPGLGDAHEVAVDAVSLQPGAVVGEVLAGGADQHRTQAQATESEGHVGGHAASPDLEVVDEERQGDLVELVDDEGVGELPTEGHQMVGRDGSGDQQGHGTEPYPRVAMGVPTSRP